MTKAQHVLGPMRVPFLVLPPACVALGAGTAVWTSGEIKILHLILAFIGAVATHISVNAFNEYFDFKSGLDQRTVPTPFSGGSGTLAAHPEAARTALITASAALGVAALVGIYFLVVWGPALLPLGLLGLIIIVVYTPWMTRVPFLCLIAPGLGFGPMMTMGTDFALTGSYTWTAFVASLVPFFLLVNLLLLNQFPDVDADQTVGRRNYPMVVGRKNAAYIYAGSMAGVYLALIVGWVLNLLPAWALLGLGTLPLGVITAIGAFRYADNLEKLAPYMGFNVILNIVTPILAAIGLFIAA
jgi:1,4-dihydroxy-2-naphthoate octaprenyltransferase